MSRFFKPALTEQDFLLDLAVKRHNKQYNAKLEVEDCEIVSIRPRKGYRLGYEIRTKATDDYLRFRIYLNLGNKDEISNYIQQVEQGFTSVENPEDEVPVAFGTVDKWYVVEKIYRFRPINNIELEDEYLELEAGGRIVLENGEAIELE